MTGLEMFLAAVSGGLIITWLSNYESKGGLSGTTDWKNCTYCKGCKKVFDRSGLNQSIYTCPGCGYGTEITSFRYFEGEIQMLGEKEKSGNP